MSALPDFYPKARWIPSPHFWPASWAQDWEPGTPKLAIVYHVMAGWVGYLDEMAQSPRGVLQGYDAKNAPVYRRVSSTFAITQAGQVRQYVKINDHAWSNGLVNKPWARDNRLGRRPDTGNQNGNIGTISIESEGTGRPYKGITPYSASNPWPEPLIAAVIDLTDWLFAEGVVEPTINKASYGVNLLGHGDLCKAKYPTDPGEEWDRSVAPRIVAAVNAPGPAARPTPVVIAPAPSVSTVPAETASADTPDPPVSDHLLHRMAAVEADIAVIKGGLLDLAQTISESKPE